MPVPPRPGGAACTAPAPRLASRRDGHRDDRRALSESPLATHRATPAELKARLEAERRGLPFLVHRDAEGAQRILELDESVQRVTIGRRAENDVALPWDSEVSRLHAVLERVAGEWILADDGLSANGTFVGPERVQGRRRLRDGEAIRCGRTVLAFRDPGATGYGATSRDDDLAHVGRLSDAQQRVLIALCRPYRDGPAFARPATNQQIADELYLSLDGVKTHLRVLFAKFGLEHLPQNAKRAELVERALRTGLVSERDLR
jgi:pSer/pThr/pTyr-binding forkhead associated (FHA) protein